jgi:hypothetical protein
MNESVPVATSTTTNRGWMIKIVIFMVAMFGLGVWGLVDALVVFPDRGREHADYAEWKYLDASEKSGMLLQAAVKEPVKELARLRGQERALREEARAAEARGGMSRAQVELQALEWLTSLTRVGLATPARTDFADPRARLAELQASQSSKNPPKPLAAYDIPMQWVFVVGGLGMGIYLATLLLRVRGTVYKWEPSTMALTLPDGRTFTPEQIKEVDKRKWDKFFVFLKPKDGSADVKLDLLRFKHLEDWILEFEKKTEGYEPPAEEPAEPASEGSPQQPA